ncbi:MAG: hypothetical protein CMK09_18770 [Ponticaulis sp.]|nr:hypothetical protein [Ponticaulis sp.]
MFLALAFGATANDVQAQSASENQYLKDNCLEKDIERFAYESGLKYCEQLVELLKKKAYSNQYSGDEDKKNRDELKTWAIEACHRGSAESCMLVGNTYKISSEGVGPNGYKAEWNPKAYDYFKRACGIDLYYCGRYAYLANIPDSEKAANYFKACIGTGYFCVYAAREDFNIWFYQDELNLSADGSANNVAINTLGIGCTKEPSDKHTDLNEKAEACQILGRLLSKDTVSDKMNYLSSEVTLDASAAYLFFIKACSYQVKKSLMGAENCLQAYRLAHKYGLPIEAHNIDPYLPLIDRECYHGASYLYCKHLAEIWKHGYNKGQVDLQKSKKALERGCNHGKSKAACRALDDFSSF